MTSSSNSFRNVTKYLGQDYSFCPRYIRSRDPTSSDIKPKEQQGYYPVLSIWQNSTNNNIWILSGIVNNLALWVLITTGSIPPFLSLTTNVGGPVVPTSSGNVLENASTSTYTDGATANTLKVEVQGTNHALKVGRGTNTPSADLTVGLTHSILSGVTGLDPAFSTTTDIYANSISFDSGSNALSIFQAGSWTPVIFGATTPGVGTYTIQQGTYYRINNLVVAVCGLAWTAHTGTGDMHISGFPFPFGNQITSYIASAALANVLLPLNSLYAYASGLTGGAVAFMETTIDAGAIQQIQISASGSNGFTMVYTTS